MVNNKINDQNVEDIMTLTAMQEGMLLYYINNPKSKLYFEQICLKALGDIDLYKFKESWSYVTRINEMLRTIYAWEGLKKPVQVVLKDMDIPIKVKDLSHHSNQELDTALAMEIATDCEEKVDLTTQPFKVSLYKLGNQEYEIVLNYHHILFDGWSTGIILREFLRTYHNLSKSLILQEQRKTKYKEFVKLCRNQNQDKIRSFWETYFENFTPQKGMINWDKNNKKFDNEIEVGSCSFQLSHDVETSIKQFIKEQNTSLALFIYSAWSILLHRYSNADDIVFGTTLSCRMPEIKQIESMVGLFINTLPLRTQIQKTDTVIELIEKISKDMAKIKEFEFTSLVDIKKYSQLEGRLFETLVVVENYPLDKVVLNNDYGIQLKLDSIAETSNFPLTLVISDIGSVELKFIYNTEMFCEKTMLRMVEHLKTIIQQLLKNPDGRVSDISIISENEKTKILSEFNNTEIEYPRSKTIHELFKEQVLQFHDEIALVTGEDHLTYRQLDEKSDQVAAFLQAKKVKNESIIGIMTHRSSTTIIAMLGILKAGGAYLPIEPSYPESRIKFMLEDSNAGILLTEGDNTIDLGDSVDVFDLKDTKIYHTTFDEIDCFNNPTNLAYVMYTSGSVGNPKGVLIEHRNVVRLVKNTNFIEFNKNDRILQTGAIAFDASTFEIWGALLNGLRLYIAADKMVLDPEKMRTTIHNEKITTLWLSAPLFNQLCENNTEIFRGLQNLLVGGDVLSCEHINKVKKQFPELNIINGYGPTENTTFSTYFAIEKEYSVNIPIGKPINNSYAYIMDCDYNLQPIGVVGELCVSGDGVARGYLNRPELSNEKFIKDPFVEGRRMYRTGDMARWLDDGNIEFFGRVDHQVKIRGFRIELQEIQSKIYQNKSVRDAVVITKKNTDGQMYLSAYVVLDNGITTVELKDYLKADLPEYMIPQSIIKLDEIPLNENGKINYSQLVRIEEEIKEKGKKYPRNIVEEKIAGIWSELLNITNIGIDEDFFVLGGNSLNVISLISRMLVEFDIRLTVEEVFENTTIAKQAECINSHLKNKKENYSIPNIPFKKEYDLSYTQKRIWFLSKIEGPQTYNIPICFEINGAFDYLVANQALKQIIDRHAVLRTSFIEIEGIPKQVVVEDAPFNLEFYDLTGREESYKNEFSKEKIIEDMGIPFTLSKAPLIRGMVFKYNDDRYTFYLNIFHMVFDGWSTGILVNEFSLLYEALLNEQEISLQTLNNQYIDYVSWQKNKIETGELEEAKQYWKEQLFEAPKGLKTVSDIALSQEEVAGGKVHNFTLEDDLTRDIIKLARNNNCTNFMVLLAGYFLLIHKITYENDIIVGVPFAGRNNKNLEPLIGCFINTLPIRVNLANITTFLELVKKLKELCIKAYQNDYPFDLLVSELNPERGTDTTPFFSTVFLMHNTPFKIDHPNFQLSIKEYTMQNSKFDFKLDMQEMDNRICGRFEYKTNKYSEETIKNMTAQLIDILKLLSNDPHGDIVKIFGANNVNIFDESFGMDSLE